MSPNDPTLQEHRADEASVSSEAPAPPMETAPENSVPQDLGKPTGTPEANAPPPPPEREAGATGVPAADAASAGPPAEPTPVATTSPPENSPGDAEVSSGATEQPAQTPAPPQQTAELTPEEPASAEIPPMETSSMEALKESSTSEAPTIETPSTESVSATGETEPRPRVTLDRSANEQAKAVPSLPSEGAGASPEENPASAPPRPSAPVRDVEIPRSAELDPAMEQELNAALAGPADGATGPSEGDPAALSVDIETLEPGTKLTGTVQLVGEETVFIDLGLRSPGMIPTRQFPEEKRPQPGQEIEVIVSKVDVSAGTLAVNLPRARHKPAGNWDAVAKGQVVDAMVTKTNKGGLEVTLGNLRGFLPASQVDLGFVEDLEVFVGQKLTCMITEVNPQKRNLVLSRRAILRQERKEKEKELWESLAQGQEHAGTVKTIKNYGAFVDLGGVDGFLHVGEISWNRINHPSDILTVGQTIQVSILKLDPESRKIGLGMKQLQSNPWADVEQKYPVGATVSGNVTRTADFGAFVELEEGVEGLIHISELDHRRVGRVTEVVKEGDNVDVKVLAVEPGRKRVSLSLKALKSKPEAEKPDAPQTPAYERKRKEPLRGGREAQTGGASGLFGNPDDYRRG